MTSSDPTRVSNGIKRGSYAYVVAESKVSMLLRMALLHQGDIWGICYANLKESAVCGWVSPYKSKLAVKSELSEKQQGRPLLLGKE